jgi:glycosyltransferase involved in cell wall biosynthesis
MPVKNTAKFLTECMDSIVNQSYPNWELWAVNDNSTDNSLSILEDFSSKDSRVHVMSNLGEGIIPALQLGYDNSKGEYITRMDSDDIMEMNKLELMVNDLQKYGSGHVSIGKVKYFSSEGVGEGFKKYEDWLNELTQKGNNFSEIYKECVIPSPCWMLSRSDFENAGGFLSDIYPEDYDLVFRYYQSGLKCIPSNSVLHNWRDYSSRTSRTHEHYADSSFIEIKTNYFLKLHYASSKNLVIWGAGKKGKFLAELLLKKDIPFQWICDNPKKIGKEIYGKQMLPFTALENIVNSQSIVTVASPSAQEEIKVYFQKRGQLPMNDYFFFC